MTLIEREKILIDEFQALKTWEERYKKIIEWGKNLDPLPEEFRIEDLKVRGCQSQVWLKASKDQNQEIEFKADSDALIVKGLIAMLIKIFTKSTAQEILEFQPSFFNQLELKEHLSPSRSNGLVSIYKQIKYYAAAFSAI